MGWLVGRDDELDVLGRAVAASTVAVVVHGEAGVGKTALTTSVLEGVSHRAGGALGTLTWMPYLPLRRAFPELPKATWTGDGTWVASQVHSVLGDSLLVLEDLHWADPGTLDVLEQLIGRVRLLLTVRRGSPAASDVVSRLEKAGAQRMDVEPLAPAAAAELAVTLRPGLDEWQLSILLDRSGGNPLLIEELSRDDGDATTLKLALLARCRQLPDSQVDGLGLLALAGRPLPATAVDATGLERSGLVKLDQAGEVSMRHALIGEVIEDLLTRERRVRCHLVLARLLTHPGDVARHLLAAGSRGAAHDAALRAVEQADTPGERWRHLVTAAEAAQGDAATQLQVRAAEAAVRAAELDAAEELVERLPVSGELRARALKVRALVAFQRGEWHSFDRALAEASDAALEGSAVQTDLMALTAYKVLLVDDDVARGYELAAAALGLAECRGHPVGEPAVVLGSAAWRAHRDNWCEVLEQAMAEGRAREDVYLEASAALEMFNGYIVNARLEEARRHLVAMGNRFRDLRLATWASCFDSCLLTAAYYCTDLAFVVTHARRLAHLPVRPLDHLDNVAILGAAHAEMGSFAEAMECARQLSGHDVFQPNLHLLTALAHLYAGQASRALLERERFEESRPSAMLSAEAALAWAWAAYEAGATPLPGPEPAPIPLMAGVAREIEAWHALSAGEALRARDLFLEAAHLHGRRRGYALRCRWAAAEAGRLAGEPDLEGLARVGKEAAQLGLVPLVVRCERSLRASGASVSRESGRGDGALTPREKEVVALVVLGHTDREIAARLGVAHRTVQTQVASARRKLGADTRAHLVALVGGGR